MSGTAPGPALLRLAALAGVEARHGDTRGGAHEVGAETLAAVLAALGHRVASEREADAAAEALAREAADRLLPETLIACDGGLWLTVPAGTEWEIVAEDGTTREGRTGDDGQLALAGLPVGLHTLRVTLRGRTDAATVLSPPEAAPDVQSLTGRARLWGVAAPLYGLRSARNLGLGTCDDLGALAEALAPLGADYLAINPVHAVFPGAAGLWSPYSASHRRFLNPLHIAPEACPDFAAAPAARALLAARAGEIARLRAAPLVDYPAVAALLAPILDALAEAFARPDALAAWAQARGPALDAFALHQALAARFGPFWPDWPPGFRDPASADTRRFAQEEAPALRRHAILQFLAEEQLRAAQARARAAGMGLGLVADLAVGVRPDGAEVWAEPATFARGASLGAPPDAFNPAGQNWQLAPFRPDALRRDGFRTFAETLRAALRWAGAVRIDHVLGFARTYWIPDGGREGAYVRFPRDELMAVTAIEARRARALAIGEDLGNVPGGLREAMGARGILGCRLVMFERGWDGAFRPPRDYPHETVAAFGSHDLPELSGWWQGADIAARERPGVIDVAEAERERARRAGARAALLAALAAEGLLPDAAADPDAAPVLALHRFLARTPSALATLQAENLFPLGGQLNLPGTVAEYPNWRRRVPEATTWAAAPLVQAVAAIMRTERPRGGLSAAAVPPGR